MRATIGDRAGTRLRWAWCVVLALALWLGCGAASAHANRFGPPWQAEVSVEQTVAYSQPDRAAPPVGPLGKGARLPVLDLATDAEGAEWARTPVGFIPASDLEEVTAPWVAEVAVPSVAVYAKPDARSAIRRTARQGDLLRVMGMSPGLDGDTGIWWATTEGYVGLDTIAPATSDWAQRWTVPDPSEALGGWWGAIRSEANVRAGPSTEAPVVGRLVPGDRVKVLAEGQGAAVGGNATWYRIDGGRYAGGWVHSSLVSRLPEPTARIAPPPDDALPGPWIVVDRSSATLAYVVDGRPQFTTYVSLGRAGVETPSGNYSTFGKYRADDMTSSSVPDADHSYDLPNVPFTQYYRLGGYAIHGAYWHDHFGSLESQGCVNLTWADAAYLFSLTRPEVPEGSNALWTDAERATPVVILE